MHAIGLNIDIVLILQHDAIQILEIPTYFYVNQIDLCFIEIKINFNVDMMRKMDFERTKTTFFQEY